MSILRYLSLSLLSFCFGGANGWGRGKGMRGEGEERMGKGIRGG